MEVKQGSRRLETAALLTLAGGCLDAYTYKVRGGVFANAQTGNIIKLGLRIAEGNIAACTSYLVPVLAFTAGVLFSLWIEKWMEKRNLHYKRRGALAMEIIALCLVSLIPVHEGTDWAANALVSFACAIQMQSFPVFIGQPIATTVSTGNLRKGIVFLFQAVSDRDKTKLKTAFVYFMIVILFITGVAAGSVFSSSAGRIAVLLPAGLMAAAELIITLKSEY